MPRNQTKLLGLFLSNFQSIKEPTYIDLSELTFLCGPNSSGKSSVIDALSVWHTLTTVTDGLHVKLARWKHRESDDPDLLYSERKSYPKLGISFSIDNRLSIETKFTELGRRLEVVSGFSYWLDKTASKLAGSTIQYEVEMGDLQIAQNVAIDGAPIYALTLDNNGDFYFESEEIPDHGQPLWETLTLDLDHWFWKNNQDLKMIQSLVSEANNESISSLIECDNKRIRIYGLVDKSFGSGRPLALNIEQGAILDSVLKQEGKGLRIEHSLLKGNHKKFQSKLDSLGTLDKYLGRRLSIHVDNIIEQISWLREIFAMKIADLSKVYVVGGDRNVISKSESEFLTWGEKSYDLAKHPDKLLQLLAIAMSVEKSSSEEFVEQSTSILDSAFGHKTFKRVSLVNDWLKTLTRHGTSYSLSVDAYSFKKCAGLKFDRPVRLIANDLYFLDREDGLFFKIFVVDSHGRHLELSDVGSGISHALPVLASLWARSSVFVQQPELHLHPSAQCEIGDIFISARNNGTCALIETHSEHLLLRVLRRIRETHSSSPPKKALRIKNSQVRMYYFDPLPNGSTRVKEIRVSKEGDFIDRWPRGFFPERAKELFS